MTPSQVGRTMYEYLCENCGVGFESNRKTARFCSTTCTGQFLRADKPAPNRIGHTESRCGHPGGPCGPRKPDCAVCHRVKKYGLTYDEWEAMLIAQNGVCAICHHAETAMGNGGEVKPLAVDHDNETGLVRGLLCQACNTAVGSLKHLPERAMSAAQYLEETMPKKKAAFGGKRAAPFAKGGGRKKSSTKTAKGRPKRGA